MRDVLSARPFLAAALALGLAAGCQTAPPAASRAEGPRQRHGVIRLMEKPRDLLEDYAFPFLTARQVLQWKDDAFEWRVDLPADRRAFVAVAFRRPLRLAARRATAVLRFKMKPPGQAARLYAAWVDGGDPAGDPVMVRQPLAAWEVRRFGGWGFYAIPLEAFGAEGVTVRRDDRPPADDFRTGAFGWDDIREMRLGVLNDRSRAQPVTINQLQIGSPWQPD